MTIKIVTDSTCDLPQSVIDALGITVVPLYINIGDEGYLDGVDITRSEFYTQLPDYESHPTTGTPGTAAFVETYTKLAKQGASEIISIHIAESLSATGQVAEAAVKEFSDVPVHVRDSGQLSLGTGFQVEQAARMAEKGESSEAILAALDDLAARTFVAAGLETLEFLRRSGRLNGVVTGLGSLLQLKVILTMRDGQAGSERVRTSLKAQAKLVELLEAHRPIERFALLHTNAADKAEAFRASVAEHLPEGEIYSIDITPVIGAHVGPDAVGFAVVRE